MIAPQLRTKILKHFQSATKPLTPKALGVGADLVTFPTRNINHKGGLSPKGHQLFNNDPEMLNASQKHREETRINIHAVIATCGAFITNNKKSATPAEKMEASKALMAGITFINENNQLDQIQTTRGNGRLLTKRFKQMMENATTALGNDSPSLKPIILAAANIQTQYEKCESQKREGIESMA